jgi:hypothetical protein
MINPYTNTSISRLYSSVAVGYIINAIIPIKIGDLIRSLVATDKKSKNFLILFSGILVERLFDIFIISFFIIPTIFLTNSNDPLRNKLEIYLVILITLALIIYFLVEGNYIIKKTIYRISSYFARDVQVLILRSFYYVQRIAKDIFKSSNKLKFAIYTIAMWAVYILGYYSLTYQRDMNFTTRSIIEYFINLSRPIKNDKLPIFSLENLTINLYPNLLLFLIASFLFVTSRRRTRSELINVGFINSLDELNFYKKYFNSKISNWQHGYLAQKNTKILKDYSGLSGATTLLIERQYGEKVYKKHAVEPYSDFLEQQYLLLELNRENDIFVQVKNPDKGETYFSYEMNAVDSFIPLNILLQKSTYKESAHIYTSLHQVLQKKLYSQSRSPENATPQRFLDQKLYQNLDSLVQYLKKENVLKDLKINNHTLENIWNFPIDNEKLLDLLLLDNQSYCHGDLTLENILYNQTEEKFLLIDPVPNEIFQSRIVDLAKLSISISSSFELIRLLNPTQINELEIWFPPLTTRNLLKVDEVHENYLAQNLTDSQILLLNLHKVIHWFRMVNRRIQENDPLTLAYVAHLNSDLIRLKNLINEN